ncbi:non-homologous end-joining DNA ligase [Spirillospora sp. NPDC048819]|uniref:non-homologous end-joining DNA ligase n=1 Tax=Spirillospora sp. NPDC048819 TaxID=3155268 RepID=UPI003408B740
MGSLPMYSPMLAVLGELPTMEGWAAELKWDGVRAVAYIRDERLQLMSRNDRDITVAWPELAPLAATVDVPVVLDGEIVAFGPDGRPSFKALGPRMHLRQPHRIQALAQSNPVSFMIFDVLHCGDESQIALPYAERRRVLQGLGLYGPRWKTTTSHDDVANVFAESSRLGMEGVVSKRVDSPYRPGRRHRDWTKTKNIRTQEVVVVGWKPGEGRRTDRIGALLLAVNDEGGRLRYAGHVGTGFTEAILDDLAERLAPLRQDDPPVPNVPPQHARDARWVRPELVGEVVFTEWTGDGRLRHPSWRGFRTDKEPGEVRRE